MKKRDFVVIVPIAVVVLGLIGFTQEGYGFYQALLASLNLLKVNFDELPANAFIEFARWLGAAFFFGLIYAALMAMIESGFIFAKTRNQDAVAVHGDSVYADMLLKALGKNGIKSSKKIAFKAPRQVLLFEDDNQAIDYFQKYSSELSKAREVHMCLELGSHVSIESENVFITNLSEVRAIDYWTKHYSKGNETIAIIGSGQLAKAVMYWGMLTNVFDVECSNNYILFGDHDKFEAIHGDMKKTLKDYGCDDICFINDEWYLSKDAIMDADRVILCDETLKNVENALDMRFAGVKCPIHLFAENDHIRAFADDSIKIVGTLSEENIKDVLLMDSIHRAGKLCHATYMVLESKKAEEVDADTLSSYINSPEFTKSWKKLDSFTRGSNFASAIHDPLKKQLLLDMGIDVKGMTAAENMRRYEALNDHDKARLQEIEHIRWCRYHLLNNWRKPDSLIMIDGVVKAKDSENKLHRDLVPYAELTADEQNKDAYSYETLSLRV